MTQEYPVQTEDMSNNVWYILCDEWTADRKAEKWLDDNPDGCPFCDDPQFTEADFKDNRCTQRCSTHRKN